MSVQLKSGQVLFSGGTKEPLGIGQQYSVQLYDPATHSFSGVSSLSTKRALHSGLELDSGKVIVSGNWYEEDNIEVYDGEGLFSYVKPVVQQRSYPYILRTASDNAIIFSYFDTVGKFIDTVWVDRYRGEPFRVPLLDQWHMELDGQLDFRSSSGFIGDESAGYYAYLLPACNDRGEGTIIKVEGEDFQLFPTETKVPKRAFGEEIAYFNSYVVDSERQRAYLVGYDHDCRYYILRVDYGSNPTGKGAPLVLYYSDPLSELVYSTPVLTENGDLVMAGGNVKYFDGKVTSYNFESSRVVYLFRVVPDANGSSCASSWKWMAGIGIGLLLCLALVGYLWVRRRAVSGMAVPERTDKGAEDQLEDSGTGESDLMRRITQLMDEQKYFLNNDLKISDVAKHLGVSRSAISNCIRKERGLSFAYFVNEYRVEYAKQLMRENPDAKLSSLYTGAGFANETSFFRTFKNFTGKTPNEWRCSSVDSA